MSVSGENHHYHHLIATDRIITQYINQFLRYKFTTSPLKIDKLSSCHSWLGTFGNLYECLITGSLNIRFKRYSARKRKTYALLGGKKMPSKSLSTRPGVPLFFCEKESYLSWFTFGIDRLSEHATNNSVQDEPSTN